MDIERICVKCKVVKKFAEFHKSTNKKYGINNQCKACIKIRDLAYKKTFVGFMTKTYSHEKEASIQRGHIAPVYSKKSLADWIKAQSNFKPLWANWVKSDYNKMQKPSIDRIDSTKPYMFGNIQLVTWEQNEKNAQYEMKFKRTYQGTKTGIRGITKHKDGGFVARIHNGDNKRIYLGYHKTLKEAEAVRLKAEELLMSNTEIDNFREGLNLRTNAPNKTSYENIKKQIKKIDWSKPRGMK